MFLCTGVFYGVYMTEDIEDVFPWKGTFERVTENPVLSPEPEHDWESGATYNATAVTEDDTVYLLYRAEDKSPEEDPEQEEYVSRIGLATSDDGIHFDRHMDEPILDTDGEFAEYEERGVEDPRITEIDDRYFLTYTAFDGEDAYLFLATSDDLEDWEEVGPVTEGKAGAILDRTVDGEYVMYQGDTDIRLLRSKDGFDWEVDDEPVLETREDSFDSQLVEPGPAPLVTDDGILLIYNSCDDEGRYHVGAALFDKEDPSELLARTDEPILSPSEDIDRDRKHDHLEEVVFCEGIVRRDDTYYLYFGSGDEVLSVATAPARDARSGSVQEQD